MSTDSRPNILIGFLVLPFIFSACVSKRDFNQSKNQENNILEALQKDDDDDGVPNFYDKDNNTPVGAVVDVQGFALDIDRDGIPDYIDEDPFTIKGAKVDQQGRALDFDGDGIADEIDLEPGTTKGSIVNFKGETIPAKGNGGTSGTDWPKPVPSMNSTVVQYVTNDEVQRLRQMLEEQQVQEEDLVNNFEESELDLPLSYIKTMGFVNNELRELRRSKLTVVLIKDSLNERVLKSFLGTINRKREALDVPPASLNDIKNGKVLLGDYFQVKLSGNPGLVKQEKGNKPLDSTFTESTGKLTWTWYLTPEAESASQERYVFEVIVESKNYNGKILDRQSLYLPFKIYPKRNWFESFYFGFSANPLLYLTSICSFLGWVASYIANRKKKTA